MSRLPFAAPCLLAFITAFLTACNAGEGDAAQDDTQAGGAESTRASAAPALATTVDGLWFEEVALSWGIDFVHDAGLTAEKHLPETMGAGAAIVDVDQDGDLDLYFVQSGKLPLGADSPNRAGAPANRLYLWTGAGYEDATARSGAAAHRGYGMGVACGDVDADGKVDFYLTNLGPDALLLGQGDASFVDGTRSAGLGDPRWNTGATFFDADADGDLDLYVLGYLEVDLQNPPWCGTREPGYRSYCHPDRFEGIADRFYLNDGDGNFREASAQAGLDSAEGKGLGVTATDFDGDGLLDLYVANDSVENRMWRGLGGGVFEDATLLSATGVNLHGATEAGMGVATGDVNGDLRVDLFITNFDEESNTLYRNDGDFMFTDITSRSGLDAPSRMQVGFGTVLADFDWDGDLDLVVTNGHIVDNIALYNDGKTHRQHTQLFENTGSGRFRERTPTALAEQAYVGRGLYTGDLDGDGWLDVVLTQCGGPARVFRNIKGGSDERALLGFAIAGAPSGTRFWLRTKDGKELVRDMSPQGSYLGSSSPRVLFMRFAGDLESLELRVPGGERVFVELPEGGPLTGERWLWCLVESGGSGWRLLRG